MAYDASLYMHDLDRKATAALRAFPMLPKLQELYSTFIEDPAIQVNHLANHVRLGENQMPEIYNLLPPICETLGTDVPDLYYVDSKEMNAYTAGISKPVIILYSGLVKKLPPKLISIVLAHECGHIACKHVLYNSLARNLLRKSREAALDKAWKNENWKVFEIDQYITPALIKAFRFWSRCSELSADRAAILCDGGARNTIELMLRIHGYDENINPEEFVKQALELKALTEDSPLYKQYELMMTEGDTHPRLAARARESYLWARSEQYRKIISGVWFPGAPKLEEQEIIAADVSMEAVGPMDTAELKAELDKVNRELDRYTSHADKADYAVAVASGILAGVIDSVFVGEADFSDNGIALSHRQVNNFIQEYARARGFDRTRLKDAIADLEKAFPVLQDNIWKGADIGVNATSHHLADIAHHPTPLGLVASMVVQFLRIGIFVNKEGQWHIIPIQTGAGEMVQTLAPAVITGLLNWLVSIGKRTYEKETDIKVPEAVLKVARIVASAPMLIEVIKCADNWFGHLVSDMGGSKSTAGGGMGIPGVFMSLLHEISSLPILKDTGLPAFVSDLYTKNRFDLRHEIVIYKELGKQAIPVLLNELFTRTLYFIGRVASEYAVHHSFREIDWASTFPYGNRTVDRMLTVSSLTFTVADTADAAVHAAIESGGNWVVFAGKFACRFNYVGAGRAAVAVVREVSSEAKEAQLIHERLLLTEAYSAQVMEKLQTYKAELEEKVSEYLAEDIEAFLEGFDYMEEGLRTGNSNLVIRGNVVIQRVLGREPQFTNQTEFDELMDSDIPLIL